MHACAASKVHVYALEYVFKSLGCDINITSTTVDKLSRRSQTQYPYHAL